MVEAVGTYRRRGAGDDTGMHGAPEEMQMGETFIFSETIKDLKTLRSQLYSAAEYFELAYMQEDGKQAVVSNLKEYAVKALVNTVDHLGSISFKVSSLVGQRFDEVAEANLRVSCIQQRTQTSQASMNREGLTQQSLVITAPKYHKRYILPAGNNSIPNAVPNFSEMNKLKNRTAQMHPAFSSATSAAQTKSKDKQASFRKLRSISRAPSQRARPSSPAQHTRFVPPSDTAIPTKRANFCSSAKKIKDRIHRFSRQLHSQGLDHSQRSHPCSRHQVSGSRQLQIPRDWHRCGHMLTDTTMIPRKAGRPRRRVRSSSSRCSVGASQRKKNHCPATSMTTDS